MTLIIYFRLKGPKGGGTNHLIWYMIEREREKTEGKGKAEKMHKYKQIRPEWLCVRMSGRAGGNGREEERVLNCITTLQTILLRLDRVELNAHGWLYKSTSHERPSAPLLWWSFKPTLMQFFFSSWNDVIHWVIFSFLWGSIHSVGQCLQVDICNKVWVRFLLH